MICRSFLSTDAAACEANAAGGTAGGAGLLGTHVDYLAVHALIRETLKGTARVATYSLARTAAAAIDGTGLAESLDAARQPPKALETACRDLTRAGAGKPAARV